MSFLNIYVRLLLSGEKPVTCKKNLSLEIGKVTHIEFLEITAHSGGCI